MAARPLESPWTARMMQKCQTNMLAADSLSNSRQWAPPAPAGRRHGTLSHHNASASTGSPTHIDSARKVSGG